MKRNARTMEDSMFGADERSGPRLRTAELVHPTAAEGSHRDVLVPTTTKQRVRLPSRAACALGLAGVSLVLWVLALPSVRVDKISGWGLLTSLPLLWYVAYAMAMAAVLVALTATASRPRLFGLALASLVLVLYATTSVTYGVPRYPWTYKHIGVTEYLMNHWSPALDVDIYQNFPGFFYLVGLLHQITQVPLLLMARYAEFGSVILNALVLYWAVGALTRSIRVRVVTVVLFTLTNWVGQTYFAPQALAFPAAIFVVGAFLRLVAADHGLPRQGPLREQIVRGRPFWASSAGVILCTAAFAVIVVSHQFTPVAVMMQLLGLTILFRLRRPWLVLLFGVLEFAWLVHAYPYISRHFSIFDLSGYENIRPPAALHPVLPGAGVIAQVPHIIVLFVVVATVAGAVLAVLRKRSIHSVLVPAVLAAAPGAIVMVQPYGQEGILRWYLFALPWCCLVIARDLLTAAWLHRRRRVAVVLLVVISALGVLAVPSVFGNEMINRVAPTDVAADQWFEQNTPTGSELLLLVPAYPSRSTGDYDRHLLRDDPLSPALLHDVPGFTGSTDSGQDLLRFTNSYVRSRAADHDVYLALGPTQLAYVTLYGLVSKPAYDDYVTRLLADQEFQLVYQRGDSYVFKAR